VFHCIPTGSAEPVTQRPYKLCHHESLWLRVQLQRLARMGVIRSSKSAWMSPVVLVKKPSGGLRLCVDLRALNKATLPDPYPCSHRGGACGYWGCTLASQMAYVTGFWQVPMKAEALCDCHKTGFTTPFGNLSFVGWRWPSPHGDGVCSVNLSKIDGRGS
jgi:hypothetical protein